MSDDDIYEPAIVLLLYNLYTVYMSFKINQLQHPIKGPIGPQQ